MCKNLSVFEERCILWFVGFKKDLGFVFVRLIVKYRVRFLVLVEGVSVVLGRV